jgi:hypothetical protein
VEKAELDVLRGVEARDWPKIQQIVVEVHDEDGRLDTVTALLRKNGLTEIMVDQPPTLGNTNIYTVFAVRKDLSGFSPMAAVPRATVEEFV